MSETYEIGSTAAFYDAYGAHEWTRLESTAYGRLQAIRHADFLRRYVRSGDYVLDAGAGPDRFSKLARIGARVAVLDTSAGQLDLARKRLAEAGFDGSVADCVRADIADLSCLDDGGFDRVVCFGGALSYVRDMRGSAAGELIRVARPGGKVSVSVMSRLGATANLVQRPELLPSKTPKVGTSGESSTPATCPDSRRASERRTLGCTFTRPPNSNHSSQSVNPSRWLVPT